MQQVTQSIRIKANTIEAVQINGDEIMTVNIKGEYDDFLGLKETQREVKENKGEYDDFLSLIDCDKKEEKENIIKSVGEQREQAKIELAEVYQAQKELDEKILAIKKAAIECKQLPARITVKEFDCGCSQCYRYRNDGECDQIVLIIENKEGTCLEESIEPYHDCQLLQSNKDGFGCGQLEINEKNLVYHVYNFIYLAPYFNAIQNGVNEYLRDHNIKCRSC